MGQLLLQRYIEGRATQQEKEEVARWLDADSENMREFKQLRNIYDATLWNENHPIIKEKNRSIKLIREFMKIAAVFVIALGCYHWLIAPNLDRSPQFVLQTVDVPEGQRAEVVLSDGTHVWLNANSTLSFSSEFTKGERAVELDGEAYFNVAHDNQRKFIVNTKDYQLLVHGTEFNVNAYGESNDFEAALINGSLEVISNATNESIMLSPSDRVFSSDDRLILSKIDTYDHFLWKEGILYFEKLPVAALFEKLELYYDVNIEVRNQDILTHQYTGKFWTKDGVEHVLRVLQLHNNFTYTKDDMNNIIIY